MIPLYILGMLLRYGPQHGYQIRKALAEQMADFTDIKLPTIYYHLEKMEAAGLITAQSVKEGVRPEKRVYQISGLGKERFDKLLLQTLDIHYRPAFEVDAALFFSDHMEISAFLEAMKKHAANLRRSLVHINEHREQVLPCLPEEMRGSAELIFVHHDLHFQAELAWAEQAIKTFKEEKEHDKGENH